MHTTTGAAATGWNRIPISGIEHFQQAVFGAKLDAVQMSSGLMRGSLAFANHGDVVYSSGYLDRKAAISGPLSETMITLGAGLNLPRGSRQWLREVETGEIGVFLAGDKHDALYAPGSVYITATLSADLIAEVAADLDLVLEVKDLGGSGISLHRLASRQLAALRRAFAELHSGRRSALANATLGDKYALECIISTLARKPRRVRANCDIGSYARIVCRAKDYILAHLDSPLTIGTIAHAAIASKASLYRAFKLVLDETPQSYVRKLRLNRIRHDLIPEREAFCTVTVVANRWGVSELGRMAGWYRELFGELPSCTRAKDLASDVILDQPAKLRQFA